MNVIVLAPHPDDEAIGCGGTIRLHADRGDRVSVIFLTSGELGLDQLPVPEACRIRESEAAAASEILGVSSITFLRRSDWSLGHEIELASAHHAPLLRSESPELIYLPHPNEWHPDHRASLPIAEAALRAAGMASIELRGYEVWTPLGVHDEVEDISGTMAAKLRAVRSYRSQLAAFRYDRAIRGLGAYRGALAAKCQYAEVFCALEPSPAADK